MKREDLIAKIRHEGNFRIFCHKGMTGLILRPHQINSSSFKKKSNMIYLTGYVLMPESTPLSKFLMELGEFELGNLVQVHGGITYFSVEDGFLWIGFDAAHSTDIKSLDDISSGEYRDMEYMESELKSLMSQLLEIYSMRKGLGVIG